MTVLDFTIPNGLWLSANDRRHWADKARATRELRKMGHAVGHSSGLRNLGPTLITAYIGYARGNKADPANERVTKPLIDGLVDAGVFPDDDHKHVIGPMVLRGPNTGLVGVHKVRLVLTSQAIPFDAQETP